MDTSNDETHENNHTENTINENKGRNTQEHDEMEMERNLKI